MTRGFLYYAHNNDAINYLKLAICSALTGRHFLSEFRATIVTDSKSLKTLNQTDNDLLTELFELIHIDDINYIGSNKKAVKNLTKNKGVHSWHNMSRPNAFNDSPYEETILVDVDFIFQENNTDKLWGSETPIRINKELIMPINEKQAYLARLYPIEYVSTFTIPNYWATVVYFDKSQFSKTFFNLVAHIKDNFQYYLKLYQIQGSQYRNDFSFSIALHMMNGFRLPGPEYNLPFKYVITTEMDTIEQVNNGNTKVITHTRDHRNEWNILNIDNISYHCLNKLSLLKHYDRFLKIYNE